MSFLALRPRRRSSTPASKAEKDDQGKFDILASIRRGRVTVRQVRDDLGMGYGRAERLFRLLIGDGSIRITRTEKHRNGIDVDIYELAENQTVKSDDPPSPRHGRRRTLPASREGI